MKARKIRGSEKSSSSDAKDRKAETCGKKDKGKSVKKPPAKVAKPLTDYKLQQLGQKWSEGFSRLEAMFLSKTFT